jgi:hypothetical protein
MKRALVVAAILALPGVARADDPPTFDPPGALVPGSGSGRASDTNVYASDMRFPIESAPAFANSQVWGHGGNSGPANSSQCDKENFQYPWHDNYCETRDWDMPLCPSGTGHQGQDVRAATCEKDKHVTVAAADGTITNIGSYSVYLTAADGTRYDYLHETTALLVVKVGDKVKKGQPIGKVANNFGTDVTTVHLHFNIHQNVSGVGSVYVPPYTSLIRAYQDLLGLLPHEDAGVDAGEPPPEEPPPEEPDAGVAPPGDDGKSGCACNLSPRSSALAPLGALLVLAALVRRRLIS